MGVYTIYFSPTKGTENIVKLVANEFGYYKEVDLSDRDASFKCSFNVEDICIVGVPSYGGRVPSVALERMENFKGNGAKAVLVVSYGNRDYDDTFKELKDYLSKKGLSCVAGVAAISEHSLMRQFATGRPNERDKEKLVDFTRQILHKIKDLAEPVEVDFPGNNPYREYGGVPLKPVAKRSCNKCGICEKSCPVGAIPKDEPNLTDDNLCITCMRCVAVCPDKKRQINPIKLKIAAFKMRKKFEEYRENELFI